MIPDVNVRILSSWSILLFFLCPGSAVFANDAASPWIDEIQAPQYFAVRVTDIEASVAWYVTALGLAVGISSEADDGAWRIVNLNSPALSVEIIYDSRATVAERAVGLFKVGFRVEDVGQVVDRIEAATGVRPLLVDSPEHGIRILQLQDPDGNRIQLSSPLPAE